MPPIVAEIIYLLCGLTSLLCAVLLGRGYRRSRARILLWSTVCFVMITVNNILLFLDLVVWPTSIDLSFPRDLSMLIGLIVLVCGLTLDAD